MLVAGASQTTVVAPRVGALTVIANAGSAALALPSLTLMTMSRVVPTSAAAGLPASLPVRVSKLPQAGLLVMPKLRASPSASVAVGWKA